jgi:hypothetical protein
VNSGENLIHSPLFTGSDSAGPDQNGWARCGRVQKNFQKKILSKCMIFPLIFFYQLCLILVYKFGIKIPGFYRNIAKTYKTKKCFVFMHTTKSLKDKKKKNHIVFSYNKTSKNICFSMHFAFNNQFIKVMRTRLIFQKYPKNILFSFSIWDYEFIRKTYS